MEPYHGGRGSTGIGFQPMPPSRADVEPFQDLLGDQHQHLWDSLERQPQQSVLPANSEEWPHKFQLDSDWVKVTRSDDGHNKMIPYRAATEFDRLDNGMGKEKINNVLGDYVDEVKTAVETLIHENPGITGSEVVEAIELD